MTTFPSDPPTFTKGNLYITMQREYQDQMDFQKDAILQALKKSRSMKSLRIDDTPIYMFHEKNSKLFLKSLDKRPQWKL